MSKYYQVMDITNRKEVYEEIARIQKINSSIKLNLEKSSVEYLIVVKKESLNQLSVSMFEIISSVLIRKWVVSSELNYQDEHLDHYYSICMKQLSFQNGRLWLDYLKEIGQENAYKDLVNCEKEHSQQAKFSNLQLENKLNYLLINKLMNQLEIAFE